MIISNRLTVPPASTQQSPQSTSWATFSLSIGQLSLKLLDPSIAWLIIQETQSTQLRRRDRTQLRPGRSPTLRRYRGGESCTRWLNDQKWQAQLTEIPIRIPILLRVEVQSQDGLPNSQLWLLDLELWEVHPIEPCQVEALVGLRSYPLKVLAFPFQKSKNTQSFPMEFKKIQRIPGSSNPKNDLAIPIPPPIGDWGLANGLPKPPNAAASLHSVPPWPRNRHLKGEKSPRWLADPT